MLAIGFLMNGGGGVDMWTTGSTAQRAPSHCLSPSAIGRPVVLPSIWAGAAGCCRALVGSRMAGAPPSGLAPLAVVTRWLVHVWPGPLSAAQVVTILSVCCLIHGERVSFLPAILPRSRAQLLL
jgi:hypothetical protein